MHWFDYNLQPHFPLTKLSSSVAAPWGMDQMLLVMLVIIRVIMSLILIGTGTFLQAEPQPMKTSSPSSSSSSFCQLSEQCLWSVKWKLRVQFIRELRVYSTRGLVAVVVVKQLGDRSNAHTWLPTRLQLAHMSPIFCIFLPSRLLALVPILQRSRLDWYHLFVWFGLVWLFVCLEKFYCSCGPQAIPNIEWPVPPRRT